MKYCISYKAECKHFNPADFMMDICTSCDDCPHKQEMTGPDDSDATAIFRTSKMLKSNQQVLIAQRQAVNELKEVRAAIERWAESDYTRW